ncbi:hypothetical protein BU16DRAFT_37273 [Lophium mytilinum]|uniref:protein-tyrosine-phosphatase n=1 Tax=Lophium mytilinum TaxID=390894 RepID=A0A6A6RIM1_9PEZI|nr:hypothetical protein BU16DRAFT_37273 [Lophium mytilinum]
MPVQTTSRPHVPMPSFMSVFGEEANDTGIRDYTERNATASHGDLVARPASSGNITIHQGSNAPFSVFHQHRDSTSTSASESSDSSPTTTISTMDSSSMTEPSPATSPESPHAKMLPSSFVADFRSRRMEAPTLEPTQQSSFFELQRPTTPAKKPRNLKNLAVKTSSLLNTGRAASTASLPIVAKQEATTSEPTSPLFVKPPTPPKRRPSNLGLTIQTPGHDNKPMRLLIPSTPSFNRPALRHFQSSPSLPLCSPSVAPSGGMQFPSLRPLKITNPHGFAEVPIEMEEEDQEPNFDIPQSREEKPAAYPHGPICIYESGVFLYFEPTAEQALNYDVIFNVASEVKNPFATTAVGEDSLEDLEARRRDGKPTKNQAAPRVGSALMPTSAGLNRTDTQDSSPTTPKATPIFEHPVASLANPALKAPEYIHIPWEHNTDIVPDLYRLVQIIDDRVQQGKRVLVHCQCGVSRSASLIVAYGLYKNPGISVQEAYDAVKKRSRWIGPNMNLIMQLQEFRNGLLRQNLPRKSAGLPTANSRPLTFEMDTSSPGSKTPRTAPLPPENDSLLQRASTGNMVDVSPGPLTAPSGGFFSPGFRRSWASSQTQTNFDVPSGPEPISTATPYVDPTGHVVPVVAVNKEDSTTQPPRLSEERSFTAQHAELRASAVPNFSRRLTLKKENDEFDASSGLLSPRATSFEIPQQASAFSPRSTEFHMIPLQQAVPDYDSFGLTSPRTTTFQTSPMQQEPPQEASITSPRSAEFHMTPLKQDDFDGSFGLLSPRATGFEVPNQPAEVRPISYTGESSTLKDQSSSSSEDSKPAWAPHDTSALSPRSSEFHMTPLKNDDFDDTYGLTSPKASSFTFGPSPALLPFGQSANPAPNPLADLISPKTAEFPRSTLNDESSNPEVTSPRSSEFHMTPLKPRDADDDSFGLTSPRTFEFSANPFEGIPQKPTPDGSLPFRLHHPIHPPAHLNQPQSENGFASLNGSASFKPSFVKLSPPPSFKLAKPPVRIDSLSTSEEVPSPQSNTTETVKDAPAAVTPQLLTHLTTPSKPNTLRTRYSSPNLQEQRRLHKLQTEIKTLLPPRSPNLPHAADDMEALMSPRATEFTRNPFHIDLARPAEDASPASSIETIRAGQDHIEGANTTTDASWLAPKPVDDDPRSPAHKGVSPIVRNIFDVL